MTQPPPNLVVDFTRTLDLFSCPSHLSDLSIASLHLLIPLVQNKFAHKKVSYSFILMNTQLGNLVRFPFPKMFTLYIIYQREWGEALWGRYVSGSW